MKNKNKIILILLCLFLVICTAGTAGILIWKNTEEPVDSESVFKDGDKVEVVDESELRDLLLQDVELVITLTEDIEVDEPIVVNGTKTLSGNGSISMALYVVPYKNLITVSEGASLILDGATVNGNGIANGIKVEKNANLTLSSGTVKFGCPYGMEVQGTATIQGGTVTDAIHTGIYVTSSGKVQMEAGTINEAGYCSTKIAAGGYLCISDNAILQNCNVYHIVNSGTCDVIGGVVRDSRYSLVSNDGELNVTYQGADGSMLEWYNAQGSGIYNNSSGVINANGLYIHDVGYAGINSGQGVGEINLTNCLFENVGNNGIHIKSATANLKDIEIKNAGKHGVFVNSPNTVATIENLTVIEPTERGLHNAGGTVTAKNVTVTSPGTYGISTGNSGDTVGSVTVENVTITGAGSDLEKSQPALNSYKSVLVVNGATITDSKNAGARATDGGQITLKNVKIDTTGSYGIYILHNTSKAIIENVSVGNTGKHGVYVNNAGAQADIKELTVTNAGERGIHNAGGTITAKDVTITASTLYGVSTGNYTNKETGKVTAGSVTIDKLTVTGAQGDSAVNSYKSVLTITNGTIKDSAKVGARVTDGGTLKLTDVEITKTGTGYEGVLVLSKGQANLKNVTVTDSGKHGVYVKDVDSKATIDTLTVTKPAERGMHNAGGTITAKNVTISSPGTYGVSTGNLGESKGRVKVTNLTVTNAGAIPTVNKDGSKTIQPAVNSYNSVLTVMDAKLIDSNGVGARVTDGGELNLTNVEITNTGEHGVYVNGVGSTSVIDTLVVSNATQRGLYNVGGTVTAKNVTTESSGEYGVSLAPYTDREKNVTRATATITGLAVKGTETVAGVMSYNSDLVIEGGTISKTKTHGAVSAGTGDLKLTDVNISETGSNGIQVEKDCTATLTDVTVTDAGVHGVYTQVGSKSTITDFTVTDCAERGVYVVGGTLTGENITTNSTGKYGVSVGADGDTRGNVTITGLTINETEANSGVMANKSDVTISDGTIRGTKTDGAVSASVGDLKLTNVSISDAGRDGVRIETNCAATLKDVTIKDAAEHGVYAMVGSTSTTTNLTVTDCAERGVYVVGGTLTGENVTTNSTGKYGISAALSGTTRATVTITGLTVNGTDANSGVMASKSDVTINDGTITGTKTDGAVAASTGTLTMTNVAVSDTGRNGVQVEKSSTGTLTDITITDAGKHGIYNIGGTVTGENVAITSPEVYGVYTTNKDDVQGSVTLTGLNVTGAKVNVAEDAATTADGAVFADNSVLTIIGTETAKTIADSSKNGAGVVNGGTLSLTNVAITNAKRHGVYVAVGSIATANGLTVTDCTERGVYVVGGTLTGENVTTNSTGKYGISAGASDSTRATVEITGLTVNGTEANSGVMAHKSDVTVNGGIITGTKTDGAVAASTGTLTMTSVSISDIGRNGVQVEKSSTGTLTGVTVTDAGNHGLYNIGGTVTAENVIITSPEVYGVYTINSGTTKGSVTITGLTVTGAKVNVAEDAVTDADATVYANGSALTIIGTETAKATITDSSKNGAGVINGGTLTLTNVAIETTGSGYDGVIVTGGGQANLNNVTVTSAGRHGVRVNVNSTATINTLTVTNCKERGVYLVGGTATASNVTINSSGKYGISLGANTDDSGKVTRASATITGLTVNGTKANSGVMAHNSDLTIIGGTITGTKTDGAVAASGGILNLTDVTIDGTGRDGVRVETNSTANLTRVTIKNYAAKETYKTATSATINIYN